MIKGNLPSSDLHATLDDLLWTSKYRLQKCSWVFSIPELSHDLKSDFTKAPQTSLLWVKIGEIIVSKILLAREGFSLLKSLLRLRLKRGMKSLLSKMFKWKCKISGRWDASPYFRIVLCNVYHFKQGYVKKHHFFFPFWKTIILVFLWLILSTQELQYEDNLLKGNFEILISIVIM